MADMTPHQKEVAKFNQPYHFHKFPATVFQSFKDETGKWQTRTQIVAGEREFELALENGWFDHPETALEALKGAEDKRAVSAAERNYDDRNMSPAAKAEAETFESHAATGGHILEIPEATKRGPGRPRKE